MLACIACSKHVNGSVEPSLDEDGGTPRSPATKDTIKSLTNQLKGMAVRFSAGAYRHCRTAGLGGSHIDDTSGHGAIDSMDILDASSELGSSSTHNSIGGSALSSQYSTPAQSFKGTPSRSRRDTPTSAHIAYTRHHHHQDSNNTSKRGGSHHQQGNKMSKKGAVSSKDKGRPGPESIVAANNPRIDHEYQNELKSECEEEHNENEKEWVAQVEPGVLITFVTLVDGGNDLKRIRFSREMFNKWQAQQWWAENCDKVHELYNVPKFNRMPGSLPTPSRSEDESYKSQSSGEFKKQNSYPQSRKQGELHEGRRDKRKGPGHARGASMVGEVMGGTDISSACASEWEAASEEEATHHQPHLSQCCSSVDQGSGEEEWIQEDDPGVYITLVSCNGSTELKRIRFSREMFTEMQARLWWEENRIRVYDHYL
ncbi:hypothetical protein GOP47_0013432 [Adiantum capillus-veneris]|uniref:BRX domain-containing protein n=1 Tax=Adiantum capillus-veneris TaxID=13818 RepID=A0A9D4UNP7_ADICA|nr:hypothetical protein GOP47_0013432 [Adiantum capillus-veneris]